MCNFEIYRLHHIDRTQHCVSTRKHWYNNVKAVLLCTVNNNTEIPEAKIVYEIMEKKDDAQTESRERPTILKSPDSNLEAIKSGKVQTTLRVSSSVKTYHDKSKKFAIFF